VIDDPCVGIEDDDDIVMEDAEVGEVDNVADVMDENLEDDPAGEGDEGQGNLKETANETKDGDNIEDTKDGDDSDGMDDDAMFRIDLYIARIFKERNLPGSETKQSQLM
jgi:DNA polymerase phi